MDKTVEWIVPNYRESWQGLPIEKNVVTTELLVSNEYLDKTFPKLGCYDYYTFTYLHIHTNDTYVLDVNLYRNRGYYYYDNNEDASREDDDYDEVVNDYIKYGLTPPTTQSMVIYDNNNFKTINLEQKYRNIIETELTKYGKSWSEITEIIKAVVTYERNRTL